MTKMANDPLISGYLKESGGFTEKEIPDIIPSGEFLTPFYLYPEKLCRDENILDYFDRYKNDSRRLIMHALNLMNLKPKFRKVINILSQQVKTLLPYQLPDIKYLDCIISGGQKDDWLFSGPIARNLGLPHISLYRDGRTEIIDTEGNYLNPSTPLEGFYGVYIVNLIATGSNVTRKIKNLNNKGLTINHLLTVVNRLQGGKETLSKQGVKLHSCVAIDEDFLNAYSSQPDAILSYTRDARAWTENYLRKNGIGILLSYFNPDEDKLPIAKKFFKNYQDFLESTGMKTKLEKTVKILYKTSLDELIAD